MVSLVSGLFSLIMEGFLLSSGRIEMDVWTTGHCAMLCLADVSCVAFFYNKRSGVCQLHNFQILTNAELSPDSGMRFYILHKDVCPLEAGYRMSRDPPLCYRISYDSQSHDQASTDCQKDGAHLIRLDSQEKNDYIAKLQSAMSHSAPAWIDGKLVDDDHKWTFADGTLMTFTNWDEENGEPNHNGNCLLLGITQKWKDALCSKTYRHVCEIPSK